LGINHPGNILSVRCSRSVWKGSLPMKYSVQYEEQECKSVRLHVFQLTAFLTSGSLHMSFEDLIAARVSADSRDILLSYATKVMITKYFLIIADGVQVPELWKLNSQRTSIALVHRCTHDAIDEFVLGPATFTGPGESFICAPDSDGQDPIPSRCRMV
jgi:hypothetical protein